jgi:choline dehydrogenase-like flavoprotein
VTTRFDVAVVGGGTAGCILAARLSEDPARNVCLIEAGPDYGPYEAGAWPDDLLDARALALSHAWETEREDRSQLRARVIGGCSAHNACLMVEGSPSDYDEWGSGWTHAELRPHLDRVRETFATRVFDADELSPWHRAFAEAAERPIVHEVNATGTVRWNAGFAYLDPARGRDNLTVLADTLADSVVLEGDRAVGVSTAAGIVNAQVVVLSCGAYGSPGVLLRSGVGPERGLPVGEGLLDHVGVGFGYEPTDLLLDEAQRFASERPVFMGQVTIPLRSSGCADGTWDMFLFPALEVVDGVFEITAAVFAMKPVSLGRVTLTSDDPRAPLAVEHGFLADEQDAAVLAEGVEQLRELVSAETIARYVARETRPGADVTAMHHVRSAARGFFHPTGTCAMGRVVDAAGRVLGLEGLIVADASIMPTIPRANTNLTTAAIAEKIAEMLA